jgi:DNA-binding response OmpR family regulator
LPGAEHDAVLLAEDDGDLLIQLSACLRDAGFRVLAARSQPAVLGILERERLALAVLDADGPVVDGLAVCAVLRARSSLPVIMLGSSRADDDVVRAFALGADDYVTKPVGERMLLARAQAVMRRARRLEDARVFRCGDVALDAERRTLRWKNIEVHLSPIEARVLMMLMRYSGRTVSAERLMTATQSVGGVPARSALNQVIYRMRRKLERCTSISDRLQAVRGSGYRWCEEDEG